jgi:competence protein ComEA
MKPWHYLLIGILIGLLATGLLMLVTRRPVGEPVILDSPPSPAPLVVYITGAVNQPGVYSFAPGSRIKDAIQSAGGLQAQADPASLNLAALLRDGDRLWVPSLSTPSPTLPPGATPQPSPAIKKTTLIPPSADQPLNINTASQAELDLLPGIGEVKAAAIIAYRDTHGPFLAIDDLLLVDGITDTIFLKIKTLVTIIPQP